MIEKYPVFKEEDPVAVILNNPIIPCDVFKQTINYLQDIYQSAKSNNSDLAPSEVQEARRKLQEDTSELELMLNGSESIQRADVLNQIDPLMLSANLRILILYLKC